MPLSEHEQRLLEQMERHLYAEDSKFAQSFRGSDGRRRRRRQLGIAVVGFLVGLGLLFVGVATPLIFVAVVGFLFMLGSAMYLLRSSQRPSTPLEVIAGGLDTPQTRPEKKKRSRRGSFMERMDERWRRRGNGNNNY